MNNSLLMEFETRSKNNETILFINKSGLPILVEGWILISNDISKLKSVLIEANEEKYIHSITSQWSITTFFEDVNIINKWKENKLKIGEKLGFFCSTPFYNGDYSWMDTDIFSTKYIDNKIIFSRK